MSSSFPAVGALSSPLYFSHIEKRNPDTHVEGRGVYICSASSCKSKLGWSQWSRWRQSRCQGQKSKVLLTWVWRMLSSLSCRWFRVRLGPKCTKTVLLKSVRSIDFETSVWPHLAGKKTLVYHFIRTLCAYKLHLCVPCSISHRLGHASHARFYFSLTLHRWGWY